MLVTKKLKSSPCPVHQLVSGFGGPRSGGVYMSTAAVIPISLPVIALFVAVLFGVPTFCAPFVLVPLFELVTPISAG